GTRHHHLRLDAGPYLEHTRDLIRVKDQPLGMHNEVAMYMLSRELRRHATVVLCGEGADELFAGYGRIFRTPFERSRARICAHMTGKAVAPPLDYFLDRYSYFPWAEKAGLYTPEMLAAADGDRMCQAVFRERFERVAHRSYHDQIALVFETVHLPGLLQMLDATTMAVGVEARVPFVDHRLVQAAFDLPEREKLRWRTPAHFLAALPRQAAEYSEVRDVTKYVLRRLYHRELPPTVLRRRKMGFPVPLTEWFSGPQRAYVRDLLLRPDARVHRVFDPRRLREWLDASHATGDPAFGRKIWLIMNLELWLEAYFG
ncbi:MAG TPA: asparagine synthase C-terminal domain-containing protein, partial [Longimicrobiaceae bacterium]|nr:asparagine synthase C-terminal domain-containing protein [Longimicrobiaceae bacterium]